MLLKFASSSIYQTAIVDCATGSIVYRTTTRACRGSQSAHESSTSIGSDGTSSSQYTPPHQQRTYLADKSGQIVAAIYWNDGHAAMIKIGNELVGGTRDLFSAEFVKTLPEETLIPTRLEYLWRLAAQSLTLLDDDRDIIGQLYEDHIVSKSGLVPARYPGSGYSFLQLDRIPPDELVEILVGYILVNTLRERLFLVTKHSHHTRALEKLRQHASRNLAQICERLRNSLQ